MDETPETDSDEPGYASALEELTSILDDLEDETIDIDVLAQRVDRAATLIAICRRRIVDARMKVEEIVADLEDGGDSGSDSDV